MIFDKKTIGVTGSLGAGKSTVANMFVQYGFSVQSADLVVHEVYNERQEIIQAIGKVFEGVVRQNRVDRKILRKHMEKYPKDMEKLEKIIHPVVRKYREDFIQKNLLCVLDVPLLFERTTREHYDKIIVVVCDREIRKRRVLQRGYTEEMFSVFDSMQMTQQQKIAKADFVIYTDKGLYNTEKQIENIVQYL